MHMYKCQSDDAPPHPTTPAHRMFASHDTQVPPYTKDRLLVRSRAPDPRAKSENRFARRSISLRRRHTWWCVLRALHLLARLVVAFRRWRGARRARLGRAAFHKLENTLLLVDCSGVLDSRNRLLRPLSRICWRQLCQAVACHLLDDGLVTMVVSIINEARVRGDKDLAWAQVSGGLWRATVVSRLRRSSFMTTCLRRRRWNRRRRSRSRR